METNVPEVIVNGIVYVPKSSVGIAPDLCENYFIVRTRSAGVFAGTILKQDGSTITMQDCRRLWHWEGAASLSQLAMEGVSKPQACKFPCEVSLITVMDCIEIISCTMQAQKSIKEVKIWKA